MLWLIVVLLCTGLKVSSAWQIGSQRRILSPIKHKWVTVGKFGDDSDTYRSLARLDRWIGMTAAGERTLEVTVNPKSRSYVAGKPLPLHPKLVSGKLENGFSYIIVPNDNPPGRFEAHLEVLSGSAHELEQQQGMAHLLEHVAYMGSPKRQLISGTGSRTNAYTDFHHTVFFASCPSETPDQYWKKPMLPMALDALLDVMTTKIEGDRMERERSAVLSEASMVNKMEYRVECQILSSLHSENRISQRFPIGKEHLIKSWKKEDLELYHNLHYRPDNVVLYIVGDVDVAFAQEQIRKKFSVLEPKVDAPKILQESKEFPSISMRNAYRHFPPVVHHWSCKEEDARPFLPASLMKTELPSKPIPQSIEAALLANSKLFRHELLQAFSFHLFAKRPIDQQNNTESFKRELMRRLALNALQVRLNVQQRKDPLFTFADFTQLNWPREGCAVCSLDISTDTKNWKEAVRTAVREIRRLGLFGLTQGELDRYKQAALMDAAQQAAEADFKSNEELLNELMQTEACGHTYMDARDVYRLTEDVFASLTLDEVNEQCKRVCEHLSHMNPSLGVQPAAIVACAPTLVRSGEAFEIKETDLVNVVTEALTEKLTPLEDIPVPKTLLSASTMQTKLLQTQPRFVSLSGKAQNEEIGSLGTLHSPKKSIIGGIWDGVTQAITGGHSSSSSSSSSSSINGLSHVGSNTSGVIQRKLSNGIRVNFKPMSTEKQRVAVRMYVPGGRIVEEASLPGTVLLGARTMQEGGACKGASREEVEMFCIDHHVMVEINAGMDAINFDFQSVTSKPSHEMSTDDSASSSTSEPKTIEGTENSNQEVSGVEGVFQVMHVILTDFVFEEDAFHRAIQWHHEEFDATVKSLETACQESVTQSITGADPRFLVPNHASLERLTLPVVEAKMRRLLRPENIEVSIAGDLSLEEMEELVLKYLGSVPAATDSPFNSQELKMMKQSGYLDAPIMTPEARLFASISTPSTSSSTSSSASTSFASAGIDSALHEPLDSIHPKPLGSSHPLTVYLQDSDERAMGYIAGPAPNRLGHDLHLSKFLASGNSETKPNTAHHQHPLHAHATLLILKEVANRRLFSIVREERRLTYDASFQWVHHDGIAKGWYLVSVTASPATVQPAIRACQEALQTLKGPYGVMSDSVQAAKRTVLNKHHADLSSNRYWTELLSGTQCDHIGSKTLRAMMDFEAVVQSVTVQDVQAAVAAMEFTDEQMTTCIGVAAPSLPAHLLNSLPETIVEDIDTSAEVTHHDSTAIN